MELVDKEKLIAQYSANPESKGFMELIQDDCVVEALKKAEVVDAAPVMHGRWKFNNKTLEYRCQQIIDGKQCNGSMDYPSDYCPDCGTKMDLEDK